MLMSGALMPMCAQEAWTIDRCMAYAVEHSHRVRQAAEASDSHRSQRNAAAAAFVPKVQAYSAVQLTSGRSIDNETNTYSDYSQFYNSYSIEASMTVFAGGSLFNSMRQAASERRMGLSALRREQDNAAIDVMQSCADVLYYEGLVQVSADKLSETDSTLLRTRRMVELGMKSEADLAQVASQRAADSYDLTHNANLYRAALMKLKQQMTLSASDTLELTCPELSAPLGNMASADSIFDYAGEHNPTVGEALQRYQAARYAHKAAVGRMMPSLTLYAGISTNYYKYLDVEGYTAASFADQIEGHRGQYVGLQLSIPLLGSLERTGAARRARNAMETARSQYDEALAQLRFDIEQALMDVEAYAAECAEMDAKVDADRLAYRITRRKFDEGMMNAIDLQTSANALALSRARRLQSRLMLMLKQRYVMYLQGHPLY